MRKVRILGKLLVAAAVVAMSVAFSPRTTAADLGASWEQAIEVDPTASHYLNYRSLHATGDVVYYRLTITQPTRLRMQLGLPEVANAKFVPQVALFKPQMVTIGPVLPIVQPPQTMALVYPLTDPRGVFDPFTQAAYHIRLDAQLSLTTPGTHYFAVYNAGSAAGEYRFVLDRGQPVAAWQDAWTMPMQWWRDQTFAGFSWRTFITPALIALGLWFVWLRLDSHQLHPHKKYPVRPKRVGKRT